MRIRAVGLCLGVALSMTAAFCTQAPAVEWMKTFAGGGAAEGHCVQQTNDGGYIAVGSTRDSGGLEFYLVKTDSLGNSEWERSFGHAGMIGAYSVQQTADDGFVLVGSGRSSRNIRRMGVYLVKTDSLGDIEWQEFVNDSAGFDGGFSVVQSEDGGFAVAATADLSGDSGLALFKTDSLGDGTWTRLYPVSYPEYGPQDPVQLRQTSDGGYMIGTKTLLKVDSFGNQQWLSTFSGTTGARSVVQTPDGGYAATGPAGGGDQSTLFLLRADAEGNLRWLRNYAQSGLSSGNWLEQTADGGYVIAGMTQPVDWFRAQLVRTDSGGNEIWSDSPFYGGAACVRQTRDGGYIVTGFLSDRSTDAQSLFLLKLAPER